MNGDDAWNGAALRHLEGVLMLPSGHLSSVTGKRIGSGLELSINGSNQPVVQAGSGVIAGPADGDGAYKFAVASAVTLAAAIPLAGAGLKRHDRMVVQLRDADVAAFGTALKEVSVERLAGTEAASPSPVAEPLGALTVGLIEATASTRTLLPHTVPRTAALGGIVPVGSQAARDALPAYDGLTVYREDSDVFEARISGGWGRVASSTELYGGPARSAAPYARITRATDANLATGLSTTKATLNSLVEETDATFGDTANSQLVAPVAGLYLVAGQVVWADNNNGLRRLALVRGGTQIAGQNQPGGSYGGSGQVQSAATHTRCTAGQAIELHIAQNSGGNLAYRGGVDPGSYLEARWVGP
jgi:hypothetical protein